MIQLKHITHYYGKSLVLDDVNLSIHKSEFVAILGTSGSGKSTLLSTMATLLQASEGEIKLLGEDIKKIKNMDDFRRKNIGFIFQFHYLIEYLNVYENITLSAYKENKDVDTLLKHLGIYELKTKYPNEISGGEQQRVAIARALVNKPKIIFADEPTGNLDSKNSKKVFELLQDIAHTQGTAVLVVTHDALLAQNADTIYRMDDGHISTDS